MDIEEVEVVENFLAYHEIKLATKVRKEFVANPNFSKYSNIIARKAILEILGNLKSNERNEILTMMRNKRN